MNEFLKVILDLFVFLGVTFCGHKYWLGFNDSDTGKGFLKCVGWATLVWFGLALFKQL